MLPPLGWGGGAVGAACIPLGSPGGSAPLFLRDYAAFPHPSCPWLKIWGGIKLFWVLLPLDTGRLSTGVFFSVNVIKCSVMGSLFSGSTGLSKWHLPAAPGADSALGLNLWSLREVHPQWLGYGSSLNHLTLLLLSAVALVLWIFCFLGFHCALLRPAARAPCHPIHWFIGGYGVQESVYKSRASSRPESTAGSQQLLISEWTKRKG